MLRAGVSPARGASLWIFAPVSALVHSPVHPVFSPAHLFCCALAIAPVRALSTSPDQQVSQLHCTGALARASPVQTVLLFSLLTGSISPDEPVCVLHHTLDQPVSTYRALSCTFLRRL